MGHIAMLAGLIILRLSPVIYGFYLVNRFGHTDYAAFVLFINYCNALIAFPMIAVTPHLLRAGNLTNKPGEGHIIAFYGWLTVLVFSLTVHFGLSINNYSDLLFRRFLGNLILVVIYSLGIGGQNIVSAILNGQQKNTVAGIFSSIVGIGSLCCGVLLGVMSGNYYISLLFFCVSYLAVVSVGLWVFNIQHLNKHSLLLSGKSWGEWVVIFRRLGKYMASGAFGVLILFGIFYLNNEVQQSAPEEASIFSLSLQMFGISLFLPSALGSILTPKLLSVIQSKHLILVKHMVVKYCIAYTIIGCGWIGVFYLFIDFLLQQYQLPISELNIKIFLIVQVAGCLAAINAAINQLAVALNHFYFLFVSALVWFLVISSVFYYAGRDALAASQGLLFGYMVTIIVGLVFFIQRFHKTPLRLR